MKKITVILILSSLAALVGCNKTTSKSSSSKTCIINGEPANPAECDDLKRNPLLP